MAVGASDFNGSGGMHRGFVHRRMTNDAARGLTLSFFVRLAAHGARLLLLLHDRRSAAKAKTEKCQGDQSEDRHERIPL